MQIEEIRIRNFRSFGPDWESIPIQSNVTAFVGGNGVGKTSCFIAMSRLFGVTSTQRKIIKSDFHVPNNERILRSGSSLDIEVTFNFPELSDENYETTANYIANYIQHLSVFDNNGKPKVCIRLSATWVDDGTTDGNVSENIFWINNKKINKKTKEVLSHVRNLIQFIYIPGTKDAKSQISIFLKSRLWKSAQWSPKFIEIRNIFSKIIQELFEKEKPTVEILCMINNYLEILNDKEKKLTTNLQLYNEKFEEVVKMSNFVFKSDHIESDRELTELSDGQRSLFHIALTSATLIVERNAIYENIDRSKFEKKQLFQPNLTILAIEEIENCLSPFFLSKILEYSEEIGKNPSAQVIISSHAPSIMSRIDPEVVRYFRLSEKKQTTTVKKILLPEKLDEKYKYIRLAIQSYPEIYFAKFVIIAEGESEKIVISRLASELDVPLDTLFVPVVPIGGRFVKHFWKLLFDLNIPHATLLDLDLGRSHGGPKILKSIYKNLKEHYESINKKLDIYNISKISNKSLILNPSDVLDKFEKHNIFFSYPLDIDFSMLNSFPYEYKLLTSFRNGVENDDVIKKNKKRTLKLNGRLKLYGKSYDNTFLWYPRLFLNRSKPQTHLHALAHIKKSDLEDNAPIELKKLIYMIRDELEKSEVSNE